MMSGTKAGAKKAAETNKKKDPDFYAKIGSKSWQGERSHKTGFALIDEETHKELSKKGGSRTKAHYHPYCDHTFGQFECGNPVKKWGEKCKTHSATEADKASPGTQ